MKKFILTTLSLFVLQSSLSFASADEPSFGMDNAGNSWSIFIESAATPYPTITVVYKPYNDVLETPVILANDSVVYTPHIATNIYGDCAAIWTREDPVTYNRSLMVSTLQAGNSWTTPVMLSQNDETIFDTYQVNLLDDGNIVVSWSSSLLEYGAAYNVVSGNINGTWGTVARYVTPQ